MESIGNNARTPGQRAVMPPATLGILRVPPVANARASVVGTDDRGTRVTAARRALALAPGSITCTAGVDPRDPGGRRDAPGAWRSDRLDRGGANRRTPSDRCRAGEPDGSSADQRGRRYRHRQLVNRGAVADGVGPVP